MDTIDTLTELEFFPFSLKINSSLQEKKGIALYAKTSRGISSWAEVSPLPSFSKETLEESLDELFFLKKSLVKRLSLEESLLFLESRSFCPSVLFGVESLLINLLSPDKEIDKLFPLCALLLGSFEQIQTQIPEILSQGFLSVKVKVSQLSFAQAHKVIEQLLGKVSLKIDVNKAWSLKNSLSFFSKYPKEAFEYIEEPVSRVEDLSHFPYPIALDETSRDFKLLPPIPFLKALVIKPMLVGGKKQIETLLSSFPSTVDLVFSSSYESGVGLFHLCSLYDKMKRPLQPLGTDTYKMIEKDILKKPHSCSQGFLKRSPLEIDPSFLEKPYV